MHPQLQAIVDEFEAASERLARLCATTPAGHWGERVHPDRWSVAECVAHLNLTGEAFVPLLRQALAEARSFRSARLPKRYRRDFWGWLLWRSSGPPVRIKVKTTAPFVPTGDLSQADVVATFERLQAEQIACTRAAEGLPLERLKVVSPFDSRIRYNLYACLTILPRHQHRHLWQAEQVLAGIGGGGS